MYLHTEVHVLFRAGQSAWVSRTCLLVLHGTGMAICCPMGGTCCEEAVAGWLAGCCFLCALPAGAGMAS